MSTTKRIELANIFKALNERENPFDILLLLESYEELLAKEEREDNWRYVARAELENRLTLPENALLTIADARENISLNDTENASIHSELSRISGIIHSWRPNAIMAVFDIIRSIAEGHQGDEKAKRGLFQNLGQAGQLAVETGRYDYALIIFEPCLNSTQLDEYSRQQLTWWKTKALNALGRYDEALQVIDEMLNGALSSQRLSFLFSLEKLKAFAGLDKDIQSLQHLEDKLKDYLPQDEEAFEFYEYLEVKSMSDLMASEEERLHAYEKLIFKFREDRLYARLAKTLIYQGDMFQALGNIERAVLSFGEAANIISENQYTGLRQELLSIAQKGGNEGENLEATRLLNDFHQPKRYLMQQKLGSGGQGAVYKALDLFTGKSCAVKSFFGINTGNLSTDAVDELNNGLKLTSRISGAGILAATDFFYSQEKLHIVTPLGLGKSVDPIVMKKLDLIPRISICIKIAELVATIHRAGLIHNDLKPDNLLFNEIDQSIEIIDFGISRFVKKKEIGAPIMGTKKFMAPELLNGKATPSENSDVYALGMIFTDWFEEKRNYLPKLLSSKASISSILSAMTAQNPQKRPALKAVKEMLEQCI